MKLQLPPLVLLILAGLAMAALGAACYGPLQTVAPLPPLRSQMSKPSSEDAEEPFESTSKLSEQKLSPPATAKTAAPNAQETPAAAPLASTVPDTRIVPETESPNAPANETSATTGESTAAAGTPPQPLATPTEVPPALDIGMAQVQGLQVSDHPLDVEIAKSDPARAASLRIVEKARQQLAAGDTDAALRSLTSANSIDPSNPWLYFYLGRGQFKRKNYDQAITFFQRAEIGFASNPAWLGETASYEGAALELVGRTPEAQAAYKRALDASPGNLMAGAGYTRLSALNAPPSEAPPAPDTVEPGGAPTPAANEAPDAIAPAGTSASDKSPIPGAPEMPPPPSAPSASEPRPASP